jgi:hypothetical protein
MIFSKPKDLRTEIKVKKSDINPEGHLQDKGKKRSVSEYLRLFLLPLLPIIILLKLLDYIHLLTFVIFGVLLLYFGVTKLLSNNWIETSLLISIGLVLVIAPVLYAFDKDK